MTCGVDDPRVLRVGHLRGHSEMPAAKQSQSHECSADSDRFMLPDTTITSASRTSSAWETFADPCEITITPLAPGNVSSTRLIESLAVHAVVTSTRTPRSASIRRPYASSRVSVRPRL